MRWLLLTVLLSSPLWAADVHPTPQERAACGGDVIRLCPVREPAAVLACLQAHRASLSMPCIRVLLERGL